MKETGILPLFSSTGRSKVRAAKEVQSLAQWQHSVSDGGESNLVLFTEKNFPLSLFYTALTDLLHKYVNCSPNMSSADDGPIQKQIVHNREGVLVLINFLLWELGENLTPNKN